MTRIFLAGLLSMLVAPVGGVAPAFAQTFLTFRCADGTEFVTVLRQGTRNAYVQLDGKAITRRDDYRFPAPVIQLAAPRCASDRTPPL